MRFFLVKCVLLYKFDEQPAVTRSGRSKAYLILMKTFCVEIVPNNVFQNPKRPANRRGVGDILRVNPCKAKICSILGLGD